jgi:hypothetical protein
VEFLEDEVFGIDLAADAYGAVAGAGTGATGSGFGDETDGKDGFKGCCEGWATEVLIIDGSLVCTSGLAWFYF